MFRGDLLPLCARTEGGSSRFLNALHPRLLRHKLLGAHQICICSIVITSDSWRMRSDHGSLLSSPTACKCSGPVVHSMRFYEQDQDSSSPIKSHKQIALPVQVAQIVEALCHKPEGRGFEPRWGSLTFFFNLPNHSGRTIALGIIQPLTEMNTRRSFWA
jgi:hypothetical protein